MFLSSKKTLTAIIGQSFCFHNLTVYKTPHKGLLGYPSCLDVKALIVGVTHREGLSRESAVLDDGREKLRLVHIGENESDTAVLLRERPDVLDTVDIVYLAAVSLDIAVEIVLERAYRKV